MTAKNTHTKCLICGCENLVHLKEFVRVKLVRCKQCTFVFCLQIPTVEELKTYYSRYGLSQYLSPITVKRYHEWLDKFESFRKTGNLLDVGCASGLFLDEAKKRGWNVFGSEYGDEQVAHCRSKGIMMHQGPLTTGAFKGIAFDVITSIEVIEHINNPVEEMKLIYSLLRESGLFYCTTPNFNALSRYFLKDKYNIISYPEHLSYYTTRTLKNLMESANFRTEHIETTGISLTRFNQSTGRKLQAVVSETSDDEVLRRKIESRWYLRATKIIMNVLFKLSNTGYSLKGSFIR